MARRSTIRASPSLLVTGDMVGVTVLGQPTLILGSFKAASDLLDTKGTHHSSPHFAQPNQSLVHIAGAIYSDRPNAVMAGELSVVPSTSKIHVPPPSPEFSVKA